MKKKITKSIVYIAFIVFFIWNVYQQKNSKKTAKAFYRQIISSKIISSKNYFGRNVIYHLKDGNEITVFKIESEKIFIGDSIHKELNTFDYRIYRKNPKNETVLVAESIQGKLIFNE